MALPHRPIRLPDREPTIVGASEELADDGDPTQVRVIHRQAKRVPAGETTAAEPEFPTPTQRFFAQRPQ